MLKNLEEKLKFIELIDEMKNINRAVLLKNDRQETNAEHSFHLAMMILVFADDLKEKIDIFKVLKLALVHDLVEIYAWDTIFLVDSKTKLNTKKQREENAFKKLKKEFWWILPEILDLIKEFEERKTKESIFVYQIDRLQPLIQYVMEWWKGWHKWKFNKTKLIKKYDEIFKNDEFWLKEIVDKYFKKAEKENLWKLNKKLVLN